MDTITLRRTYVPYCQVCARDFKPLELVWYAPIDNNVVCEECSRIHKDREPRLYAQDDIPSVACPDCGEVANISVVEGRKSYSFCKCFCNTVKI